MIRICLDVILVSAMNKTLISIYVLCVMQAAAHGLPMVATKNGGPVDINRVRTMNYLPIIRYCLVDFQKLSSMNFQLEV